MYCQTFVSGGPTMTSSKSEIGKCTLPRTAMGCTKSLEEKSTNKTTASVHFFAFVHKMILNVQRSQAELKAC